MASLVRYEQNAFPFQVDVSSSLLRVDRPLVSQEQKWHVVPLCIRDFFQNLAFKARTLKSHWFEHKSARVLQVNTSPWKSVSSLPQNFETTVLGSKVLTILRSLHGCGVFQCPAEEMFERVKRNIKKESCDTGEAMSRLGIWYNPAMDVTKECLPFLTLVEKIRRQVCLRLDDIAFTFQAQQASRNSGLEDAVKKITELTAKLYKDTSCGEALEAQLMIETTDIQKNLLREKARLKQDIEEQGNMVDFCVRTMDRLLELEQQAFGGPTPGSSDIQRINLHKITKREQVSDFCAHVGGASDSLFLRCIILKTGQEAEQVIVGSTGKRNVLFEPRKGDIEFQSKQECVELLKNKLSAAINKGRAIEVTVWKNALISPPAVSVASAAPRIVEVDESSLGVPSHSSSSEGLPYTAPMEAVASASSSR